MEFVPRMNIGGDVGTGFSEILGNVCKEKIEAFVNCSRGVYTRVTYSNLQVKLHEKTRARKKTKQKKKGLENNKGKYTNIGNELLYADICWKGTSCKLKVQHELHHVHIDYHY